MKDYSGTSAASVDGAAFVAQTCSICLDGDHDSTWHTLHCNHTFHTNCIVRWLRTSSACPICRDDPHKQADTEGDDDDEGEELFNAQSMRRDYRQRHRELLSGNADIAALACQVKDAKATMKHLCLCLNRTTRRIQARDANVRSAQDAVFKARRRCETLNRQYKHVLEQQLGTRPVQRVVFVT